MIKRFYGVNIAVKNLEEAAKKYSAILGSTPKQLREKDFGFPGLTGAQFLVAGIRINLIASMKSDTAIAKFLESKGEGVFLLSVEVTDTEQLMKDLTQEGVKFTTEKPLEFSNVAKVAFGHPGSMHGVQWEFLQLMKPSDKVG